MGGNSVVIGVAGGSGSGKTTVVRRIVESMGDNHVIVLEHDRYYHDHPELRLEERAALNYDHPDSLETDLMVRHVNELRAGSAVELPVYDFARHARRQATDTFQPRPIIIVEGILIFADAHLRDLMDVKVFVDTDDDTRFIRRLQRDVAERGRTMDSVIEQYLEHREADAPGVRRAEQALRGHHHPARRAQRRRHRHAADAHPKPRHAVAAGLMRRCRAGGAMPGFRRPVAVRFEEADARGVLFYGRLQALAHHVWEDYVVSELVDRWEDWFESREFVAPIKHAEATYHRPLRPGHQYVAELTIGKIGESSLEVVTRFLDESGPEPVLCADTRVVKVMADPTTWKKIPIPAGIRERLLKHAALE